MNPHGLDTGGGPGDTAPRRAGADASATAARRDSRAAQRAAVDADRPPALPVIARATPTGSADA